MSGATNATGGAPADMWDRKFREDLAADVAFESALLFKELWIVTITVALVCLWGLYL